MNVKINHMICCPSGNQTTFVPNFFLWSEPKKLLRWPVLNASPCISPRLDNRQENCEDSFNNHDNLLSREYVMKDWEERKRKRRLCIFRSKNIPTSKQNMNKTEFDGLNNAYHAMLKVNVGHRVMMNERIFLVKNKRGIGMDTWVYFITMKSNRLFYFLWFDLSFYSSCYDSQYRRGALKIRNGRNKK